LGAQVELLRILCDGSLEEFASYKKLKVSAFPASSGVDLSVTERNLKLLALCSVAANYKSRTIPFAVVKDALAADEFEVEMWIVEAISEGLIEGSIDQMNSVFTVRYIVLL
jgi:hypothetical protein